MNKYEVLKQVVIALEQLYKNAIAAADRAHQSATDKENVAENKYDTLGLEAAYLAEGQSKHVLACEKALKSFQRLLLLSERVSLSDEVGVGSLVVLINEQGYAKHLVIGRLAGGLKVEYYDQTALPTEIVVITPASPLGKALMGLGVGDEVDISDAGKQRCYCVEACY